VESGASGRSAEGRRVRTEAFPVASFTGVTVVRRAAGPRHRGREGLQGKDTGHRAMSALPEHFPHRVLRGAPPLG